MILENQEKMILIFFFNGFIFEDCVMYNIDQIINILKRICALVVVSLKLCMGIIDQIKSIVSSIS